VNKIIKCATEMTAVAAMIISTYLMIGVCLAVLPVSFITVIWWNRDVGSELCDGYLRIAEKVNKWFIITLYPEAGPESDEESISSS
jgi:hypothetical protein